MKANIKETMRQHAIWLEHEVDSSNYLARMRYNI